MNLKDYTVRIRRQWAIIFVTTAVFFAGGVLFASIPEEPPVQVYSAQSQVLFGEPELSSSSQQLSFRANNTAIDLIPTTIFLSQVAREVGLTVDELKESVSISGSSNPESQVLTITATSQNPDIAIDAANAAAISITNIEEEYLKAPSQVIQESETALETVNVERDTRIAKIAIATFIGFFGGLFIAFVRAWANNSVLSTTELDLLPISDIRTVKKNKFSSASENFDEQDVKQLRALLISKKPKGSSSVYLVGSDSNVGIYSDLLCELSLSYLSAGKKVLIVNADLSSEITSDIFPVINDPGGEKLSSALLRKHISQHPSGFDVLSFTRHTSDPEDFYASHEFDEFMAFGQKKYDVIFFIVPSVNESAIALSLAGDTDGMILFITLGKSGLKDLTESCSVISGMATNSPIVVAVSEKIKARA